MTFELARTLKIGPWGEPGPFYHASDVKGRENFLTWLSRKCDANPELLNICKGRDPGNFDDNFNPA